MSTRPGKIVIAFKLGQSPALAASNRHNWLVHVCPVLALQFQRTPCGHQRGRPWPASLEACEGGAQDRLAVFHVLTVA